jgi:hypothetical protein
MTTPSRTPLSPATAVHALHAPRAGHTPHLWRPLLAAAALAGLLGAMALQPAQAQVVTPLGSVRNFPEAAQRGTLTILGVQEARLNNKDIRMAPGMRLFSPQNSLVQRHTVIGQTYKVNYVVEPSSGMLHSAWILSEAEAAKPFKGSDAVLTNINATTGNVSSGNVLK